MLKFLDFIKISHTVFALPFCLIALFLALRKVPAAHWCKIAWILLAFICARAFAMAVNRILDRNFDAQNPRTADRHLPAGTITMTGATGFAAVCGLMFVFSAAMINRLSLYCSIPVLAYLAFYSCAKRFTRWSHLVLGGALGMAPLAAEIAVREALSLPTAVLAGSVVFWVAGFDIVYACLDAEFDQKAGLHSLPARIGPSRAMRVARAFHGIAFGMFVLFGFLENLGWIYFAAQSVVGGLLIYEHVLAARKKIETAFLQLNGILSLVQLCAVLMDVGLISG